MPTRSTSSPTVTSSLPITSTRRRRLASATALKTSVVVAVRAMAASYSYIGICQAGTGQAGVNGGSGRLRVSREPLELRWPLLEEGLDAFGEVRAAEALDHELL